MENLEEKETYVGLIACAMMDINTYSQTADEIQAKIKDPKYLIGSLYSKKTVEQIHVLAMEKVQNDLNIVNVKLEILKKKILKDEAKLLPYFEKYDLLQDKYKKEKTVFLNKIAKYQDIISCLIAKTNNFISENEYLV